MELATTPPEDPSTNAADKTPCTCPFEGHRRQSSKLAHSVSIDAARAQLLHRAGVRAGDKTACVQQFVSQASVEALIETVPLRRAQCDAIPADLGVVSQGQGSASYVLGSVVLEPF